MDINSLPDNPYLLLTPGPLSTTKTVKAAMLRDWCTWDDDYKMLVQEVRTKLTRLATDKTDKFTSVLMQGSGTFCVESVIGTVLPAKGKLLVLPNGAYGDRMVQIAGALKIDCVFNDRGELDPPDL
jgi:2-aminoethylphosphonate-pyruvate transaminase